MNSYALHGTSVALNGNAILITGAPGIGKSRLALSFIMRSHSLISDDLTLLIRNRQQLIAQGFSHTKNLLHSRDFGLLDLTQYSWYRKTKVVNQAPLRMIVHLSYEETMHTKKEILGIDVPVLIIRRHHVTTKNDDPK